MTLPFSKKTFIKALLLVISIGILTLAGVIIWLGTIRVPDFKSFDARTVVNSTKIYDRTGQVPLYDIHNDIKRTDIPFEDMGTYIKNATVAIEDDGFYQHGGIQPKAILRAFFTNILKGHLSQGGSTITQQIIKNTLLTSDKTLTRKLKEWVLAIKIEQVLTKDQILAIYLNENPYGGNIYGVEEAAKVFFGKEPKDMTLAEAAYVASIPKAPTHYSPYGKYKSDLDARKNTVLGRMKELGYITDKEYKAAISEKVVFKPQESTGILAPHFVLFVKDYLEQKYGKDMVESGGLKVTTTLDYNLQQEAEKTVLDQALINEKNSNASNASLVSIDPKTGQILAMVGSRNYFDKNIDGNFNVALAHRQPGSSFKPFIYATAFNMGYTPDTVLFDVPTEFQTTCTPEGVAMPGYNQSDCYMPQNFDSAFRGPMTLRNALAQSINIPAIKLFYLVGINNAIKTARDMGIQSLGDQNQYGLTLVIGGGEVSLLDMTSAYGTFAAGGVHHPYVSILRVEDNTGKVLEEYQPEGQEVLSKNTALLISDVLSDDKARVPTFKPHGDLVIDGHTAAAKTGTTNNFKDGWTIGFTPSLVTGVWAGNNDNTPTKGGGSTLAAPIWHKFMTLALANTSNEPFEPPAPIDDTIKPVLRGLWQGNDSFIVDKISGKLATSLTPKETQEEKVITNVHDILYWVDKKNPLGAPPSNPSDDPQYERWEIPVQKWWAAHAGQYPIITPADKPQGVDDVHTAQNMPKVSLQSPTQNQTFSKQSTISVAVTETGNYPLKKFDVFVNNEYVGTKTDAPFIFNFNPANVTNIQEVNTLKVVGYDSVLNSDQSETTFTVTS